MEIRRKRAVGSLRWIMVGTILVPALGFALAAWQHRDRVLALADERIDRSLEISYEQSQRIFQSIDVLLSSVDEITRGRTDQSLRLYEAQLHGRLQQLISAIPDIRSVWLFDIEGKPVATSLLFPAPNLNNSDRDYFVAQRDPNQGLYIGQILIPRVGSEPFFSVSKKRVDSTGEPVGVIAVVISPAIFERFYERLALNTSASYAMIRSDGAILARYPFAASPGLVLSENSGFRRTIRANQDGGRYVTVSGVDGIERKFSVQRLGAYPVYVTSSLEMNAIHREFIDWVLLQLSLGLPLVGMMLGLELIALRRTRELYAEAARRENAENTLRQSQKMEAVGQLTGGIAHDFNNLLTIIIGNLQNLVRQLPADSKQHLRADHALTGANRAAELTRRLLAFSRRQPLDPRPIDANEVVANAAKLLVPSLGERVYIETVRNAGLWLTDADPAEFESAIINLAVNARDAMPLGGRLTIETSNAYLDETYCERFDGLKPGQYVLISVSDEGLGMSAETVERAFEPFYTTKKSGLGTGLGLSQVYGFAKQSGGHVAIYSEINKGTTVHLYLPRSMSLDAVQITPAPNEPARGNGESILLVEDDDDVRRYLRDLLNVLNYRVVEAGGAEAALKVIDDPHSQIDLLLTDVVMPGLNGKDLSIAARKRRPKLKVLFMTGYSRNAIVHHGRLDRGVALIQKPVTENDLSSRVRAILDHPLQDEIQAD